LTWWRLLPVFGVATGFALYLLLGPVLPGSWGLRMWRDPTAELAALQEKVRETRKRVELYRRLDDHGAPRLGSFEWRRMSAPGARDAGKLSGGAVVQAPSMPPGPRAPNLSAAAKRYYVDTELGALEYRLKLNP